MSQRAVRPGPRSAVVTRAPNPRTEAIQHSWVCHTVHVARTYWIDLFTVETWKEFQDHGSDVSGFSEKRWATVQGMKPGDYLLCYLTRVSRWVGLLEVEGEPYFDEEPIWSSSVYPSRVPVRGVLQLPPEQGVPVLNMREELTSCRRLDNPNRCQGPFRGSPNRWIGHCCVGRSQKAGDWCSDVVGLVFGVRWLPVPARGDLGRGPLVLAVRTVIPGCRGAAGRARRHRRSRQ